MKRTNRASRPISLAEARPFDDSEEAWFWFVQCRRAQLDGARVAAGMTDTPRPCEPLDVLAVVNRLYRHRLLLREHLEVLADYGQRLLPPDPHTPSPRESQAAKLWQEAFAAIDPAFRAKGIVA